MKFNFILSSILAISALFNLNMVCYKGPEIDTSNNKEGIKSDEKCFAIFDDNNPNKVEIRCEVSKETRKFKKAVAVLVSDTDSGTSGDLLWKNYIGFTLGPSGKVDYCNGPCERKDKKMPIKPIVVASPHK